MRYKHYFQEIKAFLSKAARISGRYKRKIPKKFFKDIFALFKLEALQGE